MTEWGVVGVIIALVGLLAAVIKPITSLTRSITELTVVVKDLREDLDEQRAHSAESHRRIWAKNDEQDGRLNDHEMRIGRLEDQTPHREG